MLNWNVKQSGCSLFWSTVPTLVWRNWGRPWNLGIAAVWAVIWTLDTQSMKQVCWIRTHRMIIPVILSHVFITPVLWYSLLFSQAPPPFFFFASKLCLFVSRFENTSKCAKDAYEDKKLSVFWFTRISWKHTCSTSSNQTKVSGGESYWWWELCCCEAVYRQVSVVMMQALPYFGWFLLLVFIVYVFLSESVKNSWGYSILKGLCCFHERKLIWHFCRFSVEFLVWNPTDTVSVQRLILMWMY